MPATTTATVTPPRRTQLAALRVDGTEQQAIKAAAARNGLTISDLIRQALQAQGVPLR